MHVDYRIYRNDSFVWALIGVVALTLVGVLFSAPVNGTRRWFGIGGLGVQPSEFAKIACMLLHGADPRAQDAPHRRAFILASPDRHCRRTDGRADPARTRLRHCHVAGAHRGSDGLRRRPALPLSHRHAAGRAPGPLRGPRQRAVPATAAARLLGSVGGSAGRRVPDHPVAHCRRHRRGVRARTDGRRPEAVLSARAAHRFHLRGHRRRARPHRRDHVRSCASA